ncbi:MAG: hypothetical protein FWF77_07440 [Defluviitaleaceae bacterium]|nr:hypothetical protein [Defluviitaleaceae bacterium]
MLAATRSLEAGSGFAKKSRRVSLADSFLQIKKSAHCAHWEPDAVSRP